MYKVWVENSQKGKGFSKLKRKKETWENKKVDEEDEEEERWGKEKVDKEDEEGERWGNEKMDRKRHGRR